MESYKRAAALMVNPLQRRELFLAAGAFDPRDEIVRRLAAVAGKFADFSSQGIEQDQGRITFLVDAIFLRELLVLLDQLGRLLLCFRIIDFDKDQVLVGKSSKLFCRKNGLVQ